MKKFIKIILLLLVGFGTASAMECVTGAHIEFWSTSDKIDDPALMEIIKTSYNKAVGLPDSVKVGCTYAVELKQKKGGIVEVNYKSVGLLIIETDELISQEGYMRVKKVAGEYLILDSLKIWEE